MPKSMKRFRGKFDPRAALAFGALATNQPGGGGAPPPPPPPSGDPPPPDPADPPGGGRTFTQDEVNRIATAEGAKGKRAGAAEIATELGMPIADVKALIANKTAAEEAAKSEAQKALDAANAAKSTADAQAAAAAKTILEGKVTRALLVAGIAPVLPDGKPNPALDAAARLVDVADDADDAAVTAAVEGVKAGPAASFFGPVAPGPGNSVPPIPPGQTRPPGTTFGSAGAAEAAKRFPPKTPAGTAPANV